MRASELHTIIHTAELGAKEDLDVALVGRDGEKLSVFRIAEVYIDNHHGLLNIVFESKKEVSA